MKFLHLADLHFGKTLHGVSLLDDQQHFVEQFLAFVRQEKPDAVVIAGDVYDRSAPAGPAVALLDSLLTQLAELDIPVMMVSGNHDSGTRLAFGSRLLAARKLHIAGSVAEGLTCVRLADAQGPVNFWLMPYVFPALVSQVLDDDTIRDYDTAVRRLLAAQDIDFSQRNVLIAHQNVMAQGIPAERGGSETMVGGVGEIDCTAFDGFDYVALGHIHAAQSVGRKAVRYAGSPLCYHFSELRRPDKGCVMVELGAKGTEPGVRTQVLPPLHPLRELQGSFPEVLEQLQQTAARGEFLRVVLTDRQIPVDAGAQLRAVLAEQGSQLLELTRQVQHTGSDGLPETGEIGQKTLDALFAEFYESRTGETPAEGDMALIRFIAGQMAASGDLSGGASDGDIDAILRFVGEMEVGV